jgi:DNA-binding MarR family transcriptional regulator
MQTPFPAADARLAYDILTYVGIVEHLTRTRATRFLQGSGVTFPQFVLLNHFRRRPAHEPKTVSSVARAMQQPQPGITKTLQKMIQGGLIKAADAPGDGRSKLLSLTPKGVRAHDKALDLLTQAFQPAFAGWDPEMLGQLATHLRTLKDWMDTEGRL